MLAEHSKREAEKPKKASSACRKKKRRISFRSVPEKKKEIRVVESVLTQDDRARNGSGYHTDSESEKIGKEEIRVVESVLTQDDSARNGSGYHTRWNPLWWLAMGSIRIYRKFISPMKAPCCRFLPTCSEYALEAFRRHGFFKGLLLSVRRIFRCNPFGKGGFDPVPSDFHILKKKK